MTSVPLAESAFGVEGNLNFQAILRRNTAGDVLASASSPTANTEGAALLWNPVGSILITIAQLGSSGPTGLCYATSSDLGQTWSAFTQISSRQGFYPAAVINEATGDVHLVYAKRGYPDLLGTYVIYYRVLAWVSSAWAVGGESVVSPSGGSHGYSQASLAVDANGFMVMSFEDNVAGGETFVDFSVSNAPWDFTTFTSGGQLSGILTFNVDAFSIVRYLPEIGYWFALTESNGTVRVFTSVSVLSGGSHTMFWTQIGTFFVAASEQYAVSWNPTPIGATFGRVGIAYKNGSNVFWRYAEPQSATLSAPTQLNSGTGSYPAVTTLGGNWYVGWMELVSAGQQKIRLARSDNFGLVYDLDTDPAADGWGWLRFPEKLGGVLSLPMTWSDTLDPDLNDYNVYLGMVPVEVIITVQAVATAVETFLAGPDVTDTGTILESFTAGEQFTVTDTGHGSDVFNLNPTIFDAASVAETFTFSVGPATENESGTATETMRIQATLSVADFGHATATFNVGIPVSIADVAHALEALNKMSNPAETGHAVEVLGINILVQDSATAADGILAGPDVFDFVTAAENLVNGIGVFDTGSGSDAQNIGPTVQDISIASETVQAAASVGPPTQQHYTILAATGQRFDAFSGNVNGWAPRALLADDVNTRMYVFEDIDPSYTDIVFATQPLDLTTYRKLQRSEDGGKTFLSVGPLMMAYIAHGPGGVLYGVGNDGTAPANPAPPPYGNDDGTAFFGWAVTCRMVFKSSDKGRTWIKQFDDQQYGQFGRYPHYTQIAVDDSGRPLALGIARGMVTDEEIQLARPGGPNPPGWQTILIPKAEMTARSTSGALGERIGDSFLVATGSRFVFGGNFAIALLPGPDRIWTSDDYGSTWDLRYSDQLPGPANAAPFCDCTVRGGRLYAVRTDGLNLSPGKRIVTSSDGGLTWTQVPEPTLPNAPGTFSAVAYDYKLNSLYVGTFDQGGPVWRMDNPNGGTWQNVLYNLQTVDEDQHGHTSYGGLGVLSGLQLNFEIVVLDSGHAVDAIGMPTFLVTDRATAVEVLSVQSLNVVTIRLFMHRGRVRLRLTGNDESANVNNPEG